MKRKIISTLLCVSMCAALMMGCGQSDKSDTKENKKTEESKDEAKDDKLDLGLDVDSVQLQHHRDMSRLSLKRMVN